MWLQHLGIDICRDLHTATQVLPGTLPLLLTPLLSAQVQAPPTVRATACRGWSGRAGLCQVAASPEVPWGEEVEQEVLHVEGLACRGLGQQMGRCVQTRRGLVRQTRAGTAMETLCCPATQFELPHGLSVPLPVHPTYPSTAPLGPLSCT
jgi:hypothetical protein